MSGLMVGRKAFLLRAHDGLLALDTAHDAVYGIGEVLIVDIGFASACRGKGGFVADVCYIGSGESRCILGYQVQVEVLRELEILDMAQGNYKAEILTQEFNDSDLNFKIIIIGDSGVGKSCLSLQATKGVFEQLYAPTIGFEFMTFFVKVEEKTIKLQIWDTCGQEVYRSIISSFYHNSSLAIIVYSIDNEDSFSDLEFWLNELKTKGNPDINIFLIGNKADLEDKRKISKITGQEFAFKNKIKLFLESSAKTGFNAKNIFIEAAKLLYEQQMKFKDQVSRVESLAESIARESNQSNAMNILSLEEDEGDRKKRGCCKK